MKCPICGKQTLPGAKLCGPCRAALKRAKDDSVWELPPSQRPGEAELGQPRQAQWVLGTPRFASWRVWVLGIAVLGICAFAGVQFARSGEPAPAAPTTAAAVTPPIASDPPPPAAQRAVPTSTQPDGGAAPPAAGTAPHSDDAIVQPSRHADHPSAARVPKTTKAVAEPPAAEIVTPAEPPPLEPPRAAPAPQLPARPVDPWQRMQDALARCRAEDLFGRLGCEYRVRTSYCEGHWGEVAQCPAPLTNDHGQ